MSTPRTTALRAFLFSVISAVRRLFGSNSLSSRCPGVSAQWSTLCCRFLGRKKSRLRFEARRVGVPVAGRPQRVASFELGATSECGTCGFMPRSRTAASLLVGAASDVTKRRCRGLGSIGDACGDGLDSSMTMTSRCGCFAFGVADKAGIFIVESLPGTPLPSFETCAAS